VAQDGEAARNAMAEQKGEHHSAHHSQGAPRSQDPVLLPGSSVQGRVVLSVQPFLLAQELVDSMAYRFDAVLARELYDLIHVLFPSPNSHQAIFLGQQSEQLLGLSSHPPYTSLLFWVVSDQDLEVCKLLGHAPAGFLVRLGEG